MLLEYGFRNYFSFREGAEISFRLDGKVPNSVSNGKSFSTVMGFKGANASGKTTALKSLQFLHHFARWSFFTDGDADDEKTFLGFSSFYGNEDPTEFYLEFDARGTQYRYELVATDRRILSETVRRLEGNKWVDHLARVNNDLTHLPESDPSLSSIVLRSAVSIVSTLAQHKTGVIQDLISFFSRFYTNVNYGGLRETPIDILSTASYLHHNVEAAEFVTDFIRECDAGVCGIRIFETKDAKGEPEYVPMFIHKVGNVEKPVHYFTESSGTKALYRLLPQFKRTLDAGGLLVLDEIDAHLHPHLLPKLVGLFLDPATNPNNAQLVFSTHDTRVLDMLGRYRTYLVNKDDNESYVYRLDDIPGDILRNDRPISPVYNDGRVGGVPRL